MHVRVHLRRDPHRRLQRRVQLEAHLGQERQVRTEPREGHDEVRLGQGASVFRDEDGAGVGGVDSFDSEPGDKVHDAGLDGFLGAGTKCSTLGQLVGGTAAERVPHVPSTKHPRDPSIRVLLGDAGQLVDRGRGGVPAPDDDGVLPGETGGVRGNQGCGTR